MVRVRVRVELKNGVLDPQGVTIRNALVDMGYAEIGNVIAKLAPLEVRENRILRRGVAEFGDVQRGSVRREHVFLDSEIRIGPNSPAFDPRWARTFGPFR